MSVRLPGRQRVVAPTADGFTLTAPRVRCPTGQSRYQEEASARTRANRSRLLRAAKCETCGGWHVVKAAQPAGLGAVATDTDRVLAAVARTGRKGATDADLLTACGIGDRRTADALARLFLDGKLRHNSGRWYRIGGAK